MPSKESTAFAVILGGGSGTRLWPASRRARPKQLLSLGAPESLLAAAVRRGAALVGLENTLIVTAADQAAAVRVAIPDLPAANIVAEPMPRNTAAATVLGAVTAQRRGARNDRHQRRPAHARRDGLRLHPSGRAPRPARRGRRPRRRRLLRETRP